MEKQDLQNKLATNQKGAYTNIMFLSDLASNKYNKNHKVQKVVKAVVRFGVAYSHINAESIRARLDRKDKAAVSQLPWGEWDPECEYFITHKNTRYLRCTISRSPKHHCKVSYLLDGKPATLEQIMPLTRASEWGPHDREDFVYTPKIENVLAIGKEAK